MPSFTLWGQPLRRFPSRGRMPLQVGSAGEGMPKVGGIIVAVDFGDLGEADRDYLLNGCGPESIKDLVPEFEFTEACMEHDFDYIVGGLADMPDGDSHARHDSDVRFLRNMRKVSEEYP